MTRLARQFIIPFLLLALPIFAFAQTDNQDSQEDQPELIAKAGPARSVFQGRSTSFDINQSDIPPDTNIQEVLWDFGDGIRTTGEKVTHAYQQPGSYAVRLTVTSDRGIAEDTTEVQVFAHVAVLIADSSAPEDKLALYQKQAADEGLLLAVLKAKGAGPEVVTEEELTNQLIDARPTIADANLIITWTSGSVGANVLSKFAQHVRQADDLTRSDLGITGKGTIILSETPLAVLAPAAQSAFDQLQPAYTLLTRPAALELLLTPQTAEEARTAVLNSQIEYRLLGTFSARTVQEFGVTNFMSFGINFLVNRGIPINNIILVLMLPVIATILAFSRQVIGIKAFGLITPAMTTLSFLVMGLTYGLIVFVAVVVSGTVTRMIMRKFHLLYLPRMALVLTSVSLAILLLLGLGVASESASLQSFSIFPILILTLLAEEHIAVQFKSGSRAALTITTWTLVLAIACYFIVSWELLRTLIVSYPEITLLAIPINILLGRWTGLRLTEYFRFREVLRSSR